MAKSDIKMQAFKLGDWIVEPDLNRLTKGEHSETIENMAMAVLVMLAQRSGRPVSTDEIIDAIWGGRPMGDNPVYKCISILRSTLGDNAKSPAYIETISRKGYRLVAPVESLKLERSQRTNRASSVNRRWVWLATVVAVAAVALFIYRNGEQPANVEEGLASPKSVVVLPFENRTETAHDDHLGYGIADEILNRLARIDGLMVVARHSSLAAAEDAQDPLKLIEKLDVDFILLGNIREQGDQIRITAQLLDRAGRLVWSNRYDRTRSNIFALQDDVADSVTQELSLTVGDNVAAIAARTSNFDAYSAYIHGSELMQRRKSGWAQPAIDAFQEAIRLDANYAEPYAGLATAYLLSRATNPTVIDDADAVIKLALDRNPNLAEAHAAAGLSSILKGSASDYEIGEKSLRLAVSLSPSLINAQTWLSTALTVQGKRREALQILENAIRIDPLNPILNMNLGRRYQADGQLNAAREQMLKVLPYPDTPPYLWTWIADIEREAGRLDVALGWLKRAMNDGAFNDEPFFWYAGAIGTLYGQLGMFDAADRWVSSVRLPPSSQWLLSFEYDLSIAEQNPDRFEAAITQHESVTPESSLSLLSRSLIGRHAVRIGDYERGVRYLDPIFPQGWILENKPGGSDQMISTLHFLVVALQKTGNEERADRLLRTVQAMQQDRNSGRTRLLGDTLAKESVTHLLMGDRERALQLLADAVEANWRYVYRIPGNPCWDGLRSDPRFDVLVQEMLDDIELQRERVRADERINAFELPTGTT